MTKTTTHKFDPELLSFTISTAGKLEPEFVPQLTKLQGQQQVQRSSKKTWDSVTDRRILTLHPKVQQHAFDFINDVEAQLNIKLRVTQALRTIVEQNTLYAQGRTSPGGIVTYARGGQSYHNYGLAIDVVELRGNTLIWQPNWQAISKIGIAKGFDWGGNWVNKDWPHFQMTFGLTYAQLQSGIRP